MSVSSQKKNSYQDMQAPPEMLHRSMGVWHSFTLGFAVVSPVVGLYAIIGVQTTVTGGGWFAALLICLVMQLLVATVYAELSSQFPIAGGAYKWDFLGIGRWRRTHDGILGSSFLVALHVA